MKSSVAKNAAFTLFEVLIALVILAIALAGIFSSLSADVKFLRKVEDITFGHWVAVDVYNAYSYPDKLKKLAVGKYSGKESVLNQQYDWKMQITNPYEEYPNIFLVTIMVYKMQHETPVTSFSGFIYREGKYAARA